jgi:phosphoribosylglycinamide formyltransferase-1
MKIAVLASGRGSNLQAIIDAIQAGELPVELAMVVSDKADAMALERAKKAGVPAVHVDPKQFETKRDFYAAITQLLKDNQVDLVVLAGFMRIVKPPLLTEYSNRMINIHPALLPSFPGLHAQQQAADYGVKVSGCTVHFVDPGVDTGPIILQKAVPVMNDDTGDTLADRILKEEHKLYPRAIRLIAEGKVCVDGRRVYVSE